MKILRKTLIGVLAMATISLNSNFLAVDSGVTSASEFSDSKSFSAPSGIKSEDMESSVDKLVSRFIGRNISGAQVSVTKDGKTVFSKGYGLADRKALTPVSTATTFNYGSVSKMFIWVSAMQLVEQGKLDLNKDIKEYLPKDYPLHITSKEPVTFLNLMNHNAGFEGYWKYHEGSGESRDFSSLEEAVHSCYSGIQCFEPGEIQGYSNYGANLAALIIEKISGVPFSEYVTKNIFEPCGMNTCYPEINAVDSVLDNKAVGYNCIGDGKFKETAVYTGDWLYPSGSVVGTADELSKFALALMPEKGENSPLFKNSDTLNEMLKVSYSPTNSELFSIHHGFWGTDGNYRGVGHTGCVDGMVSHFLMVPDERFSVSVLTNDESGWDIAYGVASLLTGSDYEKPSKFEGGTEIFEGDYVLARTQIANRKRDFDIIKVKSLDSNNIELKAGKNSQTYRRIGQNLFENVTAKSGKNFKAKLYFKVVDGKVEKAVTFKNDLIPIDQLQKFRGKCPNYIPGKKTIKNFLATALQPVGSTMYIWGGGWSDIAQKFGVSLAWKAFFGKQDKDYKFTDYCLSVSADGEAEQPDSKYITQGLDCSGFVGWAVYNLLNEDDNGLSLVRKSVEQPKFFAKDCKLGEFSDYKTVTSVKPGDVLAIKEGHVYISLGQCKDGSVVIVDSSPPGVQIRGTKDNSGSYDSEAVALANEYMSKYYPEWYAKFPNCVSKSADYKEDSKFSWDISSASGMTDPENYADKTPKDVLKDLFSEL